MSLTNIIKSKNPVDKKFKSYLEEFVEKYVNFQTESGKMPFSKEYVLLKPLSLDNPKSYDYSVLGIAFDYLARFLLALDLKLNSSKALDNLAAEYGLELLTTTYSDNFKNPYDLILRYDEDKKILKTLLSIQKKLTQKELKEVCKIFCFFAKLECFYRSGHIFERISYYFQNDKFVEELLAFSEIFSTYFLNSKFVKNSKDVIYNPKFGFASQIIKADADLWIGETLFDFKTSYKCEKKSNDILQLVGYFLFNELNRIALKFFNNKLLPKEILDRFNKDLIKINRIAFYRARYGEIEYCDLSKISANVKEEYGMKLFEWLLKRFEEDKTNFK